MLTASLTLMHVSNINLACSLSQGLVAPFVIFACRPDAQRAVAGMPALEQLAYGLAPASVQVHFRACNPAFVPTCF